MSEMNSRERYPRYDEMTTQQLREILRKHAHGELEKEPDTEELFYIMEVLDERESENPEKQIQSTEEAYATFVKHYAPEMAEDSRKPIPFFGRGAPAARWTRWVAVVAIAAAVFGAAAVSTKAFAPELWNKVATWTQEFFRFADGTDGTQGQTPDAENNLELDSLRDALGQHGVVEKVMPNWMPEGYTCVDVSANKSPKSLAITAMYAQEDNQLIIQIRQVFETKPQQIEKSENLIEIYSVDGVDYYIFSNNKTLQTAWVVGEYECVIIGKLTLEDMKKVIDSI